MFLINVLPNWCQAMTVARAQGQHSCGRARRRRRRPVGIRKGQRRYWRNATAVRRGDESVRLSLTAQRTIRDHSDDFLLFYIFLISIDTK